LKAVCRRWLWHARLHSHLDTVGNSMLAPLRRRPRIVFAIAVAIDHKVALDAVGLAVHSGGAIGQELDIAREHERDRLVDAAETLGELRGRLRRDVRHGLAEGGAGGRWRHGLVFPVVLSYHCAHDHLLRLLM